MISISSLLLLGRNYTHRISAVASLMSIRYRPAHYATAQSGYQTSEQGNNNRRERLLAAQRPVIFSSFSGHRAPRIVVFEAALSVSRRSSKVSSNATDPIFSSS